MCSKRAGIALMVCLIVTCGWLTAGYAAETNEDEETPLAGETEISGDLTDAENAAGDRDAEDVFEAEEATVPVAPDQIESRAKGAAALLAASRFKAFNAQYDQKWKANIDRNDGKVKLLYGNKSKRYSGGPENVAFSFLKDAHAVFGMREDLDDLKTLRIDKSPQRWHVKLQQTVDGVPVRGALVLVHTSKDGQVSMVQNDYLPNFQVTNRRIISRAEAIAAAVDDLQRSRRTEGAILRPRAEELVVSFRGSHIFIWRVSVPTEKPYGLWVYHIDAENAGIRYAANEIKSLKKGKGNVFKSNSAWALERTSKSTLPYIFTIREGYSEGWLWGLHGDVYDNNDNNPYAPDFRFFYNPYQPTEKPWFDATSAYYQMNVLWNWWNKNIVRRYVSDTPDYFYDLSIPVIVNVDDTCNAFYISDLAGGLPGFVFGNEGSCAPTAEDLVLDQSVFSHEYAHAMMDWCGFDAQFDSELDQYGRAMGEGNADWHAFLFTRNPLTGDVAWAWSVAGYLRNLDNTRTYPADVDEPSAGVPEEHYTGEIWGGYLYDLSRVLKSRAVQFIYDGLYYFTPTGGHLPTEPDFYDAIYAQILAEQDLHGGSAKNAARAWGAMASRGLNAALRAPYAHASNYFGSGAAGSDAIAYYAWAFPAVKRIKTTGRIFAASGTNEFPINITEEGRTLKVTVKTKSATMDPQVELRTILDENVANGTSNDKSAQLVITAVPAGAYVILLTGHQGDFSLDVQVK
jgi:hypothetical protein